LYLHEGKPVDRVKVPVFAPVEWKKQFETKDIKKLRKAKIKGTNNQRRNICHLFQIGKCTRGASCWFMHLYSGVVGRTKGGLNSVRIEPSVKQRQLSMRVQPYPATLQPQLLAPAQPLQMSTSIQAEVTPIASQGQVTSLPEGWSLQYDSNHKCCYYFNIYSGESQWEVPTTSALSTEQAPSMPQIAVYTQAVAQQPVQLLHTQVQQSLSTLDETALKQ